MTANIDPVKDNSDSGLRDAMVVAAAIAGLDLDYNDCDRLLAALRRENWQLVQHPDGYPLPAVGALIRDEDETGVSGRGAVAWVVEFPDGATVTRWAVSDIRQTCIWRSTSDVLAIHGHNGKSRIEWADLVGGDWPMGELE